MKNRNGFTLVELLASISIIAVIATMSIIAYVSLLKSQQQKDYDALLGLVVGATKRYADAHKDAIKRSTKSINICQLIVDDYLDSDDKDFYRIADPVCTDTETKKRAVINNPKTGEPLSATITLEYNTKEGKVDITIKDATDGIVYPKQTKE